MLLPSAPATGSPSSDGLRLIATSAATARLEPDPTMRFARAFHAAYVRAGGRLDPHPDAARYWPVSDILGFLPDPAHILVSVGGARPDLTADAVRHGLEDLLASLLR